MNWIFGSHPLEGFLELWNPGLVNMEKMESINQMRQNTLYMIRNTVFMTQNTLFVNQMTQNTLFTAFIATFEKS